MYDLIKDTIKGIFLVLFFLVLGVATDFDWRFWLLLSLGLLSIFYRSYRGDYRR